MPSKCLTSFDVHCNKVLLVYMTDVPCCVLVWEWEC